MSTIQNTKSGEPEKNQEEKAAKPAETKVNAKASKKSSTAFRTISEVADELGVQQHVLRFWETKFTQVKPLKRGGGRRYYRPEDVALLKKIHHLLYTEGYTIKGVQKLMKGQGKQQLIADDVETKPAAPQAANTAPSVPSAQPQQTVTPQPKADTQKQGLSDKQRSILEAMLGDLKELRDMLKGDDQPK